MTERMSTAIMRIFRLDSILAVVGLKYSCATGGSRREGDEWRAGCVWRWASQGRAAPPVGDSGWGGMSSCSSQRSFWQPETLEPCWQPSALRGKEARARGPAPAHLHRELEVVVHRVQRCRHRQQAVVRGVPYERSHVAVHGGPGPARALQHNSGRRPQAESSCWGSAVLLAFAPALPPAPNADALSNRQAQSCMRACSKRQART